MIRCRNVAELLSSGRLDESGVWTRVQVRAHLWMCRHCARFARQIAMLRDAAAKLSVAAGMEITGGPPEDRLEARLLRKLSRP